jgi:EAL domain-containing protein (putative c-di-GMP-specific phosphodiesterase class I)
LHPSFIRDRRDPRLPALLDAIVDLTRRLDLELIAEGVEDVASRDLVLAAGFRFGQGLFFGPALLPHEAVAYANTHAIHA